MKTMKQPAVDPRQQSLNYVFSIDETAKSKRPNRKPRHQETWCREQVLHFIATLPASGKVAPKQLARILNVHLQTLYKWMRDNRLPRPDLIGLKKTFWYSKTIENWVTESAKKESFFYTTETQQ